MHDSHIVGAGRSPVRRGAVAVAALALPLAVAGFAAAPSHGRWPRWRHGRDPSLFFMESPKVPALTSSTYTRATRC